MSEAALAFIPRKVLRVAIQADDPVRRAGLCQVVSGAGHEVVASADFADVVLADGDQPASHGMPTVTLGGPDDDQAGLLPSDASPWRRGWWCVRLRMRRLVSTLYLSEAFKTC